MPERGFISNKIQERCIYLNLSIWATISAAKWRRAWPVSFTTPIFQNLLLFCKTAACLVSTCAQSFVSLFVFIKCRTTKSFLTSPTAVTISILVILKLTLYSLKTKQHKLTLSNRSWEHSPLQKGAVPDHRALQHCACDVASASPVTYPETNVWLG